MNKQNSLLILSFGRAITAFINKSKHQLCLSTYSNSNTYLHNKTLNHLMKSRSFDSALKLFVEMPYRDVITWNILISGYYRYGYLRESYKFYIQMVTQGCIENASTFSSVLSMCSNAGFYDFGLVVQCRAIVLGFSMNLYIASTLVDLYLHMGLFHVALRLFTTLPERNLPTWNVLLRTTCETRTSKELLRMYNHMKLDRVEPNGLTFCYLIQGCGYGRFLDEGMQLHCCIIKKGLVGSNLFVANALVDFYSACGSLLEAKKSFEVIPPEDVISWNSMVSVCASNGYPNDALELFQRMHFWGKKPSVSSFLGFLKLSSTTNNILLGKQIHCCLLKLGIFTIIVQSAIIDTYGKCGDIESSFKIFDSVPQTSVECCNPFMTSLLRVGLTEDVIDLFGQMVHNQIGYDEASLCSTLKALSISRSATLASCMLLHCCSIKSGYDSDAAVACSLIDAYSRFGVVSFSHKIFHQLPFPNVKCFTSIISALARNGLGKECLLMFDAMIQNDIQPDKVTVLALLMGCNHSGLVEEGRFIFGSLQTYYGLVPERQHYSCMVDLLGRAGLVDEAEQLIKDTPCEGDTEIWSSILRSCRIYRNEKVGKRAAQFLVDLDPTNPSGWLQASNFYSDIGDFESSKHFREVAAARKISKDIGRSLIEVRDTQ